MMTILWRLLIFSSDQASASIQMDVISRLGMRLCNLLLSNRLCNTLAVALKKRQWVS